MELIIAHKFEIIAFLFALSELLAIFPKIKANSVFQLISSMIKKAAGK
jgi:hypothetical protein